MNPGVSGVLVDEALQDLSHMKELWGGLVDQVSFVSYNPWENVYEAEPTGVDEPCSDLWRRMFIWHDGAVNPCDTDYQSSLKVGAFNGASVTELWRSKSYNALRKVHLEGRRESQEPCRRCAVI